VNKQFQITSKVQNDKTFMRKYKIKSGIRLFIANVTLQVTSSNWTFIYCINVVNNLFFIVYFIRTIQRLLQISPELVYARNEDGETGLLLAARHGHLNVVEVV
jgi:ankyrin repeat protein